MKIEKDKWLHFGVNALSMFICSMVVFWASKIFRTSTVLDAIYAGIAGACLSIGLSLGKEYGDSKASGNKWSWADIVADLAGMAVGCVAYIIVLLFTLK